MEGDGGRWKELVGGRKDLVKNSMKGSKRELYIVSLSSVSLCFYSFNLTIRATYTGRGLSGQLGRTLAIAIVWAGVVFSLSPLFPSFPDIDYILRSNIISTVTNVQNRLVFDAQNNTQVTRTLSFSSPGTETTDTVTVYARVSYRKYP